MIHDDHCHICRRARRQRRAARIRAAAPWLALSALVLLMALGEQLTHLVGP